MTKLHITSVILRATNNLLWAENVVNINSFFVSDIL